MECFSTFPTSEVWFQCMHLDAADAKKHSDCSIDDYKKKNGAIDMGDVKKEAKKLGFTKRKLSRLLDKAPVTSESASAPTTPALGVPGGVASGFFSTGAAAPAPAVAANTATNPLGEEVIKCIKNGYFGIKGDESKTPKSARCPICDRKAYIHVCPDCYKPLTREASHKKYIINLAGTKYCGKSVYIGALMYQIHHKLSQCLNGWNVELISETAKEERNQFIKQLKAARANDTEYSSDGTTVERSKPAIIRITNGRKTYDFAFYDIAGEIFNLNLETREGLMQLQKGAHQFMHPDFIIMLTNPRQCSGAEEEIREYGNDDEIKFFFPDEMTVGKDSSGNPITAATPESVTRRNSSVVINMSAVINRVQQQMNDNDDIEENDVESSAPYDIPVAVCLTAVDKIKTMYDRIGKTEKLYMKRSELTQSNNFDIEELEERSCDLEDQFGDWKEQTFISLLNDNFGDGPKTLFRKRDPKIMFFGTSSLGDYREKEASKVESYKPINVLDPFAWILYLVGKEEKIDFFDSDNGN